MQNFNHKFKSKFIFNTLHFKNLLWTTLFQDVFSTLQDCFFIYLRRRKVDIGLYMQKFTDFQILMYKK
jgi:hypothetical protein